MRILKGFSGLLSSNLCPKNAYFAHSTFPRIPSGYFLDRDYIELQGIQRGLIPNAY